MSTTFSIFGDGSHRENTPKNISQVSNSGGFIRAEVVAFDDMIRYKGRVGAREVGKARSEGRDYIVQDGDVITFKIGA